MTTTLQYFFRTLHRAFTLMAVCMFILFRSSHVLAANSFAISDSIDFAKKNKHLFPPVDPPEIPNPEFPTNITLPPAKEWHEVIQRSPELNGSLPASSLMEILTTAYFRKLFLHLLREVTTTVLFRQESVPTQAHSFNCDTPANYRKAISQHNCVTKNRRCAATIPGSMIST